MATEVRVHEAKTNLSKLLRQVAEGDEVIILRDHEPVAKLVPFEPRKRVLGGFSGQFEVPDNFDDPLPDEIVDAFYQ